MHFLPVLVTLMCIIYQSEADNDHKVAYLKVDNAGEQGFWGSWQICPDWGLAIGFWFKIQLPQGPLTDDTALNAIALRCSTGGWVTSSVGYDGSYSNSKLYTCGKNKYLKRFRLRVQPVIKGEDDTSANDIEFKCGYKMGGGLSTLSADEGGELGTFGSWSEVCPDNSAICGIRTRIHSFGFGDKTALNNVTFVCCF